MKAARRSWRAAAVLGWQGALGAALLLAAGGLQLFVVSPRSARLDDLQHESASLKSRIERAAQGGLAEAGGAEEIGRFHAHFAGTAQTEWLRRVYAAAATHGLVLERGEYRGSPIQGGKLVRYQITLPVKGSYPQIRRFVDQILADVPVAAIDDISFKRESIGATQLEARIRLALFVGAGK